MAVEIKPGSLFMVRVDDIIPYENNPRINDHAVKKMAQGIREFGFVVPGAGCRRRQAGQWAFILERREGGWA